MPTASVDTFFACSLMVLLVLSAMATTSKLLYPHINNIVDYAFAERCREVSKYLLLNPGSPSNWGQNGHITPENFGLAKEGSQIPYELDVDKVSRLNSENLYAVKYAEIFTALKLSDLSFRIEIKPIFDVTIELIATFAKANETTYQFTISTTKNGAPIQTELKCYIIAEDYLYTLSFVNFSGEDNINITISNDIEGPAVLVALAKAICDSRIASYGVYAFAHNSINPKPKNTFLNLSPINYTLEASFLYPEINISKTYILSINYNSTLQQISHTNQSATYRFPVFLDPSPTIIVVTGWNVTDFFIEWVAYPLIPLHIGVNFEDLTSLSSVFAYNYIISVNFALYQCTVWIRGIKNE